MKRIAFIMMAILLAVIPSTAQNYKNSRYYNKRTGHLDYRYNHSYGAPYFGFRIGPAFTYVNSDDPRLDGGDWQTGLNVGVVAGIPLTDTAPLYLETGLSYIEKGGKKDLVSGKKMTYDLNYLQIPAVLKYKYDVDDHFSIQPQFGGYGIGYDMFYADLTYDIGLVNICHDSFDKSHNGALLLSFGVNF